jgi:hypothetical protein
VKFNDLLKHRIGQSRTLILPSPAALLYIL